MPQSKEVHKEYMRKRRGSQNSGVHSEGSQIDTVRAAKLSLICHALDKTVTGIDGQRVNLLSMVRYGVNGPTMESIKAQLH